MAGASPPSENHFSPDFLTDYAVFASSDFDPNEYANAILAADTYPSESRLGARAATNLKGTQDSIAKEDISVAISKLTFGIEDVSKNIRNLVRDVIQYALPKL